MSSYTSTHRPHLPSAMSSRRQPCSRPSPIVLASPTFFSKLARTPSSTLNCSSQLQYPVSDLNFLPALQPCLNSIIHVELLLAAPLPHLRHQLASPHCFSKTCSNSIILAAPASCSPTLLELHHPRERSTSTPLPGINLLPQAASPNLLELHHPR